MDRQCRSHRLHFDDDAILNNQICAVGRDEPFAFVNDRNGSLPFEPETPLGEFELQTLGIRRWAAKGIEKVKTEWLLICAAFNLRRMLSAQTG